MVGGQEKGTVEDKIYRVVVVLGLGKGGDQIKINVSVNRGGVFTVGKKRKENGYYLTTKNCLLITA